MQVKTPSLAEFNRASPLDRRDRPAAKRAQDNLALRGNGLHVAGGVGKRRAKCSRHSALSLAAWEAPPAAEHL